jgi:DNA invertase Pin-like site-specific DNA recombinase
MAGQRIGYVRVSTFEQNAHRQLDEIPSIAASSFRAPA